MSVRLMLCAALAALVVSATAASEPTTEARSYAIAIGGVELRPKRDRVIVSVHNLGARPLRRVTVRVSADGGRPRAAPVIGVIPGGGHMETVSVDVSTRDARLVFVTVADEAGWACASRLLRPGRRDIVDAALFLEAHAPEIVTSDRAFRLDLVFRAGPRRGVGGRPRGKGWMSLKLPAGVELVEGEAHRALHLDQPRGITFQLVAKRAGRYRLGAILRRDDGAARAGTVIDLIVRKGAGSGDGLPHEESFGDEDARPDAAQEAPRVEHGAVYNALVWLAAHQSADGGWKAAGFDKWCNGKPNTGRRPDGFGKAPYDPGVTGLALRAFLDAGYTHRGKHPFNDTVGRGLRHLRNIQDAEGCFGPRSSEQFVYNHAAATMAMTKAYDLTQSPLFRGAARRALQFIGKARNPDFAWRYGVRPGDNDTSVSGWMMLAIRGADVETAPRARGRGRGPARLDRQAHRPGLRARRIRRARYGSCAPRRARCTLPGREVRGDDGRRHRSACLRGGVAR